VLLDIPAVRKCTSGVSVENKIDNHCKVTVNQSHYRPEGPKGVQEVKVPRLRDNGPGWW